METMREIVLQELNEKRFNRKHIDAKIRAAIEASKTVQDKLKHGIQLVQAYMAPAKPYYASKTRRISQLENMDIPEMVLDMFVGIAYFQRPELFTSVSSQMASRLKFSDQAEAITTVAELLAVLCQTDAFDITKANKQASLMVESRVPLTKELVTFIENSQFLPPMVCEPLELVHNYSSGYLTHNDSLILGSGNHHDGDLCLDVLNLMNKVALKVDTDFLSNVEETPNEPITPESVKAAAAKKGRVLNNAQAKEEAQHQLEQWARHKQQAIMFYLLMAEQGNKFYFNHKVDKRGRIYSHGYHLSPQGAAFKKATLEFANEELVDGVP